MNWKNWPYWLKGGIWGLIIALIGTWAPMTIAGSGPVAFAISDGLIKLMTLLSAPLSWLFCKGPCTGEQIFTIILTGPLTGLLYGIMVGHVYGKIKNRNSYS